MIDFSSFLSKLEINEKFDTDKLHNVFDYVTDNKELLKEYHCDPFSLMSHVVYLKLDLDTIISVLLHRFFLEGNITDDEVLKLAGKGVLNILRTVRKLGVLNNITSDNDDQIGVLRNMFISMAKDIRVVLVVLLYRFCLSSNLELVFSDPEVRTRFATETLDLYVPVAARLGLYNIKVLLEDLAFKYSLPVEYSRVSSQLNCINERCSLSIEYVKNLLVNELSSKWDVEVSGRIKSVYSIYKKMKKKNLSFVDELYDVYAIRIVLNVKDEDDSNASIGSLYSILGAIHANWKPISNRFKDYIAVPKSNGYRSLHTVLLGISPSNDGQPVEVQIRDSFMHAQSEYGVASHWSYKESGGKQVSNTGASWVRDLEVIRNDFISNDDSLTDTQLDFLNDRIFVLTPTGDVRDLPRNSTPIDFAYTIHTDIGHTCVMAKVNQRVVPLDYALENGDVVEVLTKKDASPKLQWISKVKSAGARQKIKAYFASLNSEENLKLGKELINKQLARLGKPSLDANLSILKKFNGADLSVSRREKLIEEVGNGGKTANDVVRKIYPYSEVAPVRKSINSAFNSSSSISQILVGGESGLPLKLASCCNPKDGDSIVAYVPRGNSITIHKSDCKLLSSLDSTRFVDAMFNTGSYVVELHVIVKPRVGFIRDLSLVISDFKGDIVDFSINRLEDGTSNDLFVVSLPSLDNFDNLLDAIEGVDSVLGVYSDV